MLPKAKLVDGVIGDSRMLATLTGNGQLQRLWWPNIDYAQHVDQVHAGILLEGDAPGTRWIHHGDWHHRQEYVEDTNILVTEAVHPALQVTVKLVDFVPPGEDTLVRWYHITNQGAPRQLRFVFYASVALHEHARFQGVQFEQTQEAMVHFRREHHLAWGSQGTVRGFQCGWAYEPANEDRLMGNPVAMDRQSAMQYDLGILESGATVKVPVYLALGHSREEALALLEKARQRGAQALYDQTAAYWREFLAQAKAAQSPSPGLDRLYRRSLLTCRLLWDQETGGILAAPEFDEGFTQCGGYGFCWPRDGAFVAQALDRAGCHEMAADFYRKFAVQTQDPAGFWHQRYWLKGMVAPSWGRQVDETGSVLWGAWQHYKLAGKKEFLVEVWPMLQAGADYLLKNLTEKGLPGPSHDLWEERVGVHAYSCAAVYGGLTGAAEAAEVLGHSVEAALWRTGAVQVREAIGQHLVQGDDGGFHRSIDLTCGSGEFWLRQNAGEKVYTTQDAYGYLTCWKPYDDTLDTSLLGLVEPFEAVDLADGGFQKTLQKLVEALWVPGVGGLRRYAGDSYAGGNPWVITTLWLGLIYGRQGKAEELQNILQWVESRQTSLGLLPEQVHSLTGQPAWVIPLTWSHAMLILAYQAWRDLDGPGDMA